MTITALGASPITGTGIDLTAGIVNVRHYGARGDGVTDDTAALQAAINAAGSGGLVLIPGTAVYLFSQTLLYPDNLIVASSGGTKAAKGTLKYIGAAGGTGFAPKILAQSNEKFVLADIELDGNHLLNIGVDLYHVSHSSVNNAYIHDCDYGSNATGVRLYRNRNQGFGCYYNRIVGGKISGCTIGIFLTGTGASSQDNCANSNSVEYVDLLSNGTSVYQERGNDLLILAARSEAPTVMGFRFAGVGGHVIGCRLENAAGTQTLPGIQCDSTSGNLVEVGNYFAQFTNDPVVDNGAVGDRIVRLSTFGSGVNGGAQVTVLSVLGRLFGTGVLDLNGGTFTGSVGGAIRFNRLSNASAGGNIVEFYDNSSTQIGRFARLSGSGATAVIGLLLNGGISPGTDAGAIQTGKMLMGSGAPNNANGNNGDYYFRTDTPGTANQRLYVKSAGAWAGVV